MAVRALGGGPAGVVRRRAPVAGLGRRRVAAEAGHGPADRLAATLQPHVVTEVGHRERVPVEQFVDGLFRLDRDPDAFGPGSAAGSGGG